MAEDDRLTSQMPPSPWPTVDPDTGELPASEDSAPAGVLPSAAAPPSAPPDPPPSVPLDLLPQALLSSPSPTADATPPQAEPTAFSSALPPAPSSEVPAVPSSEVRAALSSDLPDASASDVSAASSSGIPAAAPSDVPDAPSADLPAAYVPFSPAAGVTTWGVKAGPLPAGVRRPPMARTEPRRPQKVSGWLSAAAIVLTGMLIMVAVPCVGPALQGLRAIEGTPRAEPAAVATDGTPVPTTTPRFAPIYRLGDHPVLAAGVRLPESICTLPPFRRDTGSLNAYYAALVTCLDNAWRPVLTAGGMPHQSPSINLAEHPGQTGCGDPDKGEGGEFTALYCPADQTLYLPVDRLRSVDRGGPSSHLAVVAHEYAHHVQELSGLLGAGADERDKVGESSAAGNEVTRRIELQANCFAGLFLASVSGHGAVSRTLANQAVADFRNGGLPETHGSRNHQASWATKGSRERTTAACNTWTAPEAEVS